jgi:hypothetical protein
VPHHRIIVQFRETSMAVCLRLPSVPLSPFVVPMKIGTSIDLNLAISLRCKFEFYGGGRGYRRKTYD